MAERLLTGWGRTSPTRAEVRRPRTDLEVADALAAAGRRGVTPRGLGRAYGDAAQNAGGLVLEATGLDLLDLSQLDETGTITAGGGVSLDRILSETVSRGWFVPVSPGTRQVTVGGAIAADVHGKNHHRDGSFGAHVTEIVLASPTGVHVVGPDDERFWATVGGMGLTGVVLRATIRMTAIPSDRVLVDTDRARDLDEVLALMSEGDDAYPYSVAWIDSLARGGRLGRSVLTRGRWAPPDGSGTPARPWRGGPAKLSVPRPAPGGLLGTPSVRAFNELWYRKAPRRRRAEPQGITAFFHPLDGVGDWNRLYGPRGLVQYQCVVPPGAEDVLRRLLEALAAHPAPAFLSVLKRFGPGGPGHLSFPTAGWTLAVDVPAAVPGLGRLLDGLDEQVIASGGRLYLAKDSRARPEVVRAMLPRLGEWRAVRDRLDPDGVLTSDLDRRLQLTRQHQEVR